MHFHNCKKCSNSMKVLGVLLCGVCMFALCLHGLSSLLTQDSIIKEICDLRGIGTLQTFINQLANSDYKIFQHYYLVKLHSGLKNPTRPEPVSFFSEPDRN